MSAPNERVPMLTDREKELREWLRGQPGGDEWWMVIKAGFRLSYDLGVSAGRESGSTPRLAGGTRR